jgi:hypothetical protein
VWASARPVREADPTSSSRGPDRPARRRRRSPRAARSMRHRTPHIALVLDIDGDPRAVLHLHGRSRNRPVVGQHPDVVAPMRLATGSMRRSRRSPSDSSMSSGARLGKPRRPCRELAGGFGLGVVPHQSASLLVARVCRARRGPRKWVVSNGATGSSELCGRLRPRGNDIPATACRGRGPPGSTCEGRPRVGAATVARRMSRRTAKRP